jgi:glycosyltransferase involved in cell wall biosynthesis
MYPGFKEKSLPDKPIEIAFLSAGLGRISRGFEISSSAWHSHVRGQKNVNARLFSGGKFKDSTKVWNCPRNGYLARLLRRFHVIADGCRLEQISFGVGFLLQLVFYKPDIVWLQEASLADVLLKIRKIFKLKYKILFCDGAPVGHAIAKKFDYLIFLHQFAYEDAIKDGFNPGRGCVIPHLYFESSNKLPKYEAREFLKVRKNQFVVLCVAAWNRHHKRIDYLIEEISKIKSGDVVLVLCGQEEQDTPYLKQMSEELKIEVRWHTFSQEDLSKAYLASDLFVLPSLSEALGAVLIEAGTHGLPVICHPHQAGKYIFGDDYQGLVDLSKIDNLSNVIVEFKNTRDCQYEGLKTKEILDEKFSCERLTSSFMKFIQHISENKLPTIQ